MNDRPYKNNYELRLIEENLPLWRQFMANPGMAGNKDENNLYESLGLYHLNLNSQNKNSVHHMWEAFNRFYPIDERQHSLQYYENHATVFSSLKTYFANAIEAEVKKDRLLSPQGIKHLLVTMGGGTTNLLKTTLPNNNNRLSLLMLNDKIYSNTQDWLTYIGGEKIYIIKWFQNISYALAPTTTYQFELGNERYDYINLEDTAMVISDLTTKALMAEDGTNLISATELLHCMINIKPWSEGLSTKSMDYFNAVISTIGYNAIPIYAIDYAAYTLTREDFSRYIVHIIRDIEKQQIIHPLPNISVRKKDGSVIAIPFINDYDTFRLKLARIS